MKRKWFRGKITLAGQWRRALPKGKPAMIRILSARMRGLAAGALCALAAGVGGIGPQAALAQAGAPGTAPAVAPVTADRVAAAMRLDLLAEVLAAEIAAAGDPFRLETPDRAPDAGWAAIAARIASPGRIRTGLRAGVAQGIGALDQPDDRRSLGEALDFWEAPLGRQVVLLEIAAREAMAEPGIEDAARDAFAAAAARGDPRIDKVRALVVAGDLVEPAVAASLNIAVAALQGALEAQGLGAEPSILDDAWLQEAEIRADQAGWIEALVHVASAPLSDAELDVLTEAAGRPGHRRLNAIMNEAATATFIEIARDLGRASGLRQLGERL